MKIRKLLLTCTAIAGISAAFAVAANAEPITNNTYDKTAGTVSVASDLTGYAGDQMTVIVIPESAYESATIADTDILYIDQDAAKADGAIFQGMGLKGGTTLPDGDYYIKVGGTNIAADGIIVEKITIASEPTYKLGDVNEDGDIRSNDASLVLDHVVGLAELTGTPALAADVNKDGDIRSNDASLILDYVVGLANEF